MTDFLQDPRFAGLSPLSSKLWLSSPTMHGDEQKWVDEAIQTNWVSTLGENINEVERQMAEPWWWTAEPIPRAAWDPRRSIPRRTSL